MNDESQFLTHIIQGTPEWRQVRCGRLTASRVAEAIATIKSGGWGSSRANLMAEYIAERLTGIPAENYTNGAMTWGTEKEPEARQAYADQTFLTVREIGFVLHASIPNMGCSPDGLVEEDGLVQIKCPMSATHIDTLLKGKIDQKYKTQMQMEMACTDRKWCDFVSYDPRMPENMRLWIKRVERDEKFIRDTEILCMEFLGELDKKVFELKRLYDANI